MERIIAYIGDTIQLAPDSVGAWYDFLKPAQYPGEHITQAIVTRVLPGKKKAAPVPAVKMDPVLNRALIAGKLVHQVLINAGITEPAATFGTYASYHETQAFTSPLFVQHNNGSGIKFAGQKGAVKGTNGYAWFPGGIQDWAAAYRHELTKGSNPAGAKTIEDFAARLKANRYYEDSYSNYVHGLANARLVLRTMPAAEWDYNANTDYNPNTGISTEKKTDKFMQWWEGLSTVEKAGMGLAAFTGLVILTRR